jgi:hypothetical protein
MRATPSGKASVLSGVESRLDCAGEGEYAHLNEFVP